MKNKKSIYILLPVVLLIWGAVLYQFFYVTGSVSVHEGSSSALDLEPLAVAKKDSVSINVNYRDPFLGKLYGAAKKQSTSKKQAKVIVVKEPLVWPSIVYKGIVSDTKDKTKVFMLLINGRTFLMKKGDAENEIMLLGGTKASVEVKYKDTKNVIPLQQ